MSASSPIPNIKAPDAVTAMTDVNENTVPQRPSTLDAPKQNLRSLNKPKCIKCGNVARSRCPFQSCKSCCSKAQNPCYIHVLKQDSVLPDKLPSSTTTSNEQPPADVPSTGRTSWRLSALRQLSGTCLNYLRVNKPLTRKEFVNIRKWRFSKLKEHFRGNIEAENEGFQRYLQNVNLLEEIFSIKEAPELEDHLAPEAAVPEDKIKKFVSTIKVKLKSNAVEADKCREKMRSLVDQKLRKLRELELVNEEFSQYADEHDGCVVQKKLKVEECLAERTAAVNDLVDKLNNARSDDDLKSCLDMLQLFKQSKNKVIVTGDHSLPKQESDSMSAQSYSVRRVCSVVPIDQDTLSKIDVGFSSLNQIAKV